MKLHLLACMPMAAGMGVARLFGEVVRTQSPLSMGTDGVDPVIKLEITSALPPNSNSPIQSIKMDQDGNLIHGLEVRGPNNLYARSIRKLSLSTGAPSWTLVFPALGSFSQKSFMDITPEGDVIVFRPAGFKSNALEKYNGSTGVRLWQKFVFTDTNPSAIKTNSAGDIYAFGDFENDNDSDDCFAAKFSGVNGDLLRLHNTEDEFSITAFSFDNTGNVLLTGQSEQSGNTSNFRTVRLSGQTFLPLWTASHGNPGDTGDQPKAIAADVAGNVFVTGSTGVEPVGFPRPLSGKRDIITIKYEAATGGILWSKRFDSPANRDDTGALLAVDAGGNPVIAGLYSGANGTPVDTTAIYLCKYNGANGNILWEQFFPLQSTPTLLSFDTTGDVILGGWVSSFNNSSRSAFCGKYRSSDGTLLREVNYRVQGSTFNSPDGFLADSADNWTLAGGTSSPSPTHYFLLKTGPPIPPGRIGIHLPAPGLGQWIIQRSTDLMAWTNQIQSAPDAHGYIDWIDDAPLPGSGFYRLKALGP